MKRYDFAKLYLSELSLGSEDVKNISERERERHTERQRERERESKYFFKETYLFLLVIFFVKAYPSSKSELNDIFKSLIVRPPL